MNWINTILNKVDEQYDGCADPHIRSILNSIESEVKFAFTNRAFKYALSFFSYNELEKMEEIDSSEFYVLLTEVMVKNPELITATENYYKIPTDGMDYYHFSVVYGSGFGTNAGYDCDTFYCKVKTMTKAERAELEEIFTEI